MYFSGIISRFCCYAIARLCLVMGIFFPCFADNKNGASPNTISLPSGPGSITGLGESFQPMLNTGTVKYSVPISLPSGTAGDKLQLSLNYESGFGDGPAGIGWKFGPENNRHRTDNGIKRYINGPNGHDDDCDGDLGIRSEEILISFIQQECNDDFRTFESSAFY